MTTQDQPLVEREAIARIVDPGPWGHLDCVLELPEGARGGETYAVNACKPSLAKAAEIQALLSTSRPETEAKLAAPTAELVKRARAEIARNDVDTAAEQAFDALADHLVSTASKLAAVVAERDEAHNDAMDALLRLQAAEARLSGVVEAAQKAFDLVDCIKQRSADSCWWVDASDPETAVCDTYEALRTALQSAREGEGRLRPSGLGDSAPRDARRLGDEVSDGPEAGGRP